MFRNSFTIIVLLVCLFTQTNSIAQTVQTKPPISDDSDLFAMPEPVAKPKIPSLQELMDTADDRLAKSTAAAAKARADRVVAEKKAAAAKAIADKLEQATAEPTSVSSTNNKATFMRPEVAKALKNVPEAKPYIDEMGRFEYKEARIKLGAVEAIRLRNEWNDAITKARASA